MPERLWATGSGTSNPHHWPHFHLDWVVHPTSRHQHYIRDGGAELDSGPTELAKDAELDALFIVPTEPKFDQLLHTKRHYSSHTTEAVIYLVQ